MKGTSTKGVQMMRAAPGGTSLIGVVYLIIGAVIASQHHFFSNLDSIKLIASALLAILLWPLILAGVDLHLR